MKPPGLFVTGTDTEVGKTYVACRIAESLRDQGRRVGVYKPAESGIAPGAAADVTDSERLWQAAGLPGEFDRVCPQRFSAPLAPHLAARLEARTLDADLLRTGLEYWQQNSDLVLIEGAGGLMSPLGDDEYVADLAYDFGYPLLVVADNTLGVINRTLQTLISAATFRDGLDVAGIVLNGQSGTDDASVATNRQELESRCVPPLLAELAWGSAKFDREVDWYAVAK